MKLIHGDCLEEMKNIPDGSVDMVLTDPPYSFPTNFSTYQHFFNMFLDEVIRVTNKDGDVYVFCDEVFYAVLYPLFYSRFYSTKMIIWNKCRIGKGGMWRRQFEVVLHARMRPAKLKSGDGDIVECKPIQGKDKQHQSQKPVELCEKLISKNSLLNGTVLDPFMGSGTTGVACKNLNRDFIGIELDETYFNIAKQRIENHLLAEGIITTL